MARDSGAPQKAYFELRGEPDAERFFPALGDLVPDASTLFIEVGGPADDVASVYQVHADEGPFLPKRQTIWPRASTFRLRFSSGMLNSLGSLAAHRATPEFVDHLSVFDGETALLHYPDAFLSGAVIYASRSIPGERLRTWAQELGLEVRDTTV